MIKSHSTRVAGLYARCWLHQCQIETFDVGPVMIIFSMVNQISVSISKRQVDDLLGNVDCPYSRSTSQIENAMRSLSWVEGGVMEHSGSGYAEKLVEYVQPVLLFLFKGIGV